VNSDLHQELSRLIALRGRVDEALEWGLIEHASLRDVALRVLPMLCEEVGAKAAFLRTYGENLELTTFVWPEGTSIPEEARVFEMVGESNHKDADLTAAGSRIIACPLDVVGTWFGAAGAIFESNAPPDARYTMSALHTACEVLDNYLFAVKAAREKHRVMMALGTALRHRVLSEGVREAVQILGKVIPLGSMLLVYLAEEDHDTELHVHHFVDGKVNIDTMTDSSPRALRAKEEGRRYLAGQETALLTDLGISNAQEEVLINGITNGTVVGKIVASSKRDSFNTYNRELLSGFANFIRQRIVDFNKEWRALSSAFSPSVVGRLLGAEDYNTTYLSPREETVGILYVDIAGFTKLSETVLRTPSAVAALVEEWSREAVNLVWKHGGVFDKMVGDCVIALFGPPFYDDVPGDRLKRAIDCALEIRAMTQAFPQRPGFDHLRETGLAVSTGVNLAPLFVGKFGPDGNFTGFSSGMNNTARLQGCATRDEIVVMEDAIRHLPDNHPFAFGPLKQAAVKNVAEPLKFRAVNHK